MCWGLAALQAAFGQAGPICIAAAVIDDDDKQFAQDMSLGNGNGQAEAGEVIRWKIFLVNAGAEVAPEVSATLYTASQEVAILHTTEPYGSLLPGQLKEPINPYSQRGGFLLSIGPLAPSDSIRFLLEIRTGDGQVFHDSLLLAVRGGRAGPFEVHTFRIDDDRDNFAFDQSAGNGDGLLQPGETIGLPLCLANLGDFPAIGLKTRLESADSRVELLNTDIAFPIIDSGRLAWPRGLSLRYQFQFRIADSAEAGELLLLIHLEGITLDDTTLSLKLYIQPAGMVSLEAAPPFAGELHLFPPTPNPFSSTTRISYFLPVGGDVQLWLLNHAGQQLRLLAGGYHPAGLYQVVVDSRAGPPLPRGLYLCLLQTQGQTLSRRLLRL